MRSQNTRMLCRVTVAVNTENADEKSIMLYLSQLYRFFYEQRGSRVQAKRVARVLDELLHVLHDAADFEMRASDLIRCACSPIFVSSSSSSPPPEPHTSARSLTPNVLCNSHLVGSRTLATITPLSPLTITSMYVARDAQVDRGAHRTSQRARLGQLAAEGGRQAR